MKNEETMQNPKLHSHMIQLFKDHGYTQLEVCEKIGISPAYLSQAIRQSSGKHLTPNILLAIAKVFDLPWVEIIDIAYLATKKSSVITVDVSNLHSDTAFDVYMGSIEQLENANES